MNIETITHELHAAIGNVLGDQLATSVPLPELLPIPVVLFPEADFLTLVDGARLVLSAQQKILRSLRQRVAPAELLERLCVPTKARRFIDWTIVDSGEDVLGRIDVIPLHGGGYRFCELNIGPAIEGPQMHGHCERILRRLGLSTSHVRGGRSPYADVGTMIRDRCRRDGRERVVILDLDSYNTTGPLVYEELRRYVADACEGREVHLLKNSAYRHEWLTPEEGKKTLVYRLFLEEELDSEWPLIERIVASGALFVNGFESYVLSSKAWFHIFHDPAHRDLLDADEIAAIEELIPLTHELTPANLESILVDKDRFVFKMANSTEGRDVLIGAEHAADKLRSIMQNRLSEWSAQEYMRALALDLPQTHWSQRVRQNVILGLYHIDGVYSGLLFRSNANSRVVNLASGGKVAWALRVTDVEHRLLVERIAGGDA